MRENIRVAVRFRPLNKREQNSLYGQDFRLRINNNSVQIGQGTTETHNFTFDNVFDTDSSQTQIYNSVAKNVVEWVTKGYNATIFAFGQTGSGKTFTMFGHEGVDKGIIPRACEHLFELIERNDNIVEATVKCSFLEIYREHVRDLQKPAPMGPSRIPTLRIRQSAEKGIYVQGLMEKYVYSAHDILQTIEHSSANRSTAMTTMNDMSSRSHAVLTITLSQTMSDGSINTSKLNLVDLAGSENVGKSQVTGTNLIEAQTINKSLSALGNVIYALTEKGRDHVPYRDSRLTYLLQDSLGGNSKSTLLAAATPDINSYAETLNTLKFAKRTKQIKNVPLVNTHQSNATLQKIIQTLQKKIQDLEDMNEDNVTVIQKVERSSRSESTTQLAVLSVRCERLTKKLTSADKLHDADDARYEAIKAIFDKQRNLAQSASMNLYKEKMQVCAMTNELREHKMFYDSLKESMDIPAILGMIVKNANIKSRRLSIVTTNLDMTPLVSVEVDSPP